MKIRQIASLSLLSLFLGSGLSYGADFSIDQTHSEVGFKVRHLVSKTRGRFDQFSGSFSFDAKKPASLKAEVTVQTASVNTNNEKRDGHLKNEDFFAVEKFPTMKFVSTKARKAGKGKVKLMGNLTMLGKTKPVTLDVEFLGEGPDPWGNSRIGFSASGTLNRKDWGMVYNITDKGGLVIGDEVTLLIEVEGIKKK